MVEKPGETNALEQAEAKIASQEEEIRRLQQQLSDNRFADELRQSLRLAGVAGALGVPQAHARLLTMILEMASQVVNSTTASISLVDEKTQELEIQRAVGPGAEEAQGLRFPLGHGIAGLVAASGQPMAISDARADARHAGEIAEQTGYQPDTILCVPLVDDERVIGVLQVMDKAGGQSFTTMDIQTLGLFAEQAAIAVEQSRIYTDLATLIGQILASSDKDASNLVGEIAGRAFAGAVQDESDYREMLELAQLVQQIAGHGEQERRLCVSLLQSMVTYLRDRPRLTLATQIW
jgi:GAF domain-containing protein